MNFGEAIEKLKAGAKVARIGWNAKQQFLYYVPASTYPSMTEVAKKEFGETVAYRDYIALKTVTGEVVPWTASQSDALGSDWEIVN